MDKARRTFYIQVRKTAFDLWDGPGYIETKRENPELVGGDCVLRLALRQRDSARPLIEARAAYAFLAHEEQHDAILRAVSWDSQTVARNSSLEQTPIRIPARFVQLPIAQVQQWMRTFGGLQTSLPIEDLPADDLSVCSLRVAPDYFVCAFEKTWQVVPGEQDELTGVWLEVWHKMGAALQTYPVIADIEEAFPCIQEHPEAYDVQAYQPLLTLP